MASGSQGYNFSEVGSAQEGTHVGHLVLPYLEPTGPFTMERGQSPSLGGLSLLNPVDQVPGIFEAPQATSGAQTSSAVVDLAKESPAPLVKAGTAQLQALTTVTGSAGQTEKYGCPVKASEVHCDPFSDGFHAGDPLVTLDRADFGLFHSMRSILESDPPTEHMGCPAETSAVAECLISVGLGSDEPLFSLGKADTEIDRAFNGLVLSNYALSPPRVGIEVRGVPSGDVGGRVEGASDIQGTYSSHQANRSVLALIEVEKAYAVEVLGDVDSSSPLMSINPLELNSIVEVNGIVEVRRFDNSLNVSNWVKHRLPGFSKMMGLSLGQHEKRCIMLLQRLQTEIEAAKLVHRKDVAHQKAVSRAKGKRDLRNLISSVNYDGR